MSVVIDGKALAKKIEEQLAAVARTFAVSPTLAIVRVGTDAVMERFVRTKTLLAERIGVSVVDRALPESTTTEELLAEIVRQGNDARVTGIVLQLPLPSTISVESALAAIPIEKDVDVLSSNAMGMFRQERLPILPPVVGAIQAILESENVHVGNMDALVIGKGRLVGAPAALWLRQNGAHVTQIEKGVPDISLFTKDADLIVTGAGVPSLVKKEMLKDGVILLDAGTSEQGGVLRGDVDPACKEAAQLFTPVPGGIGPLTAVMLLKNLFVLARTKHESGILK